MATKRNDLQGFNSGKSLNDCINEVMNGKSSRSSKRKDLIKLGLRDGDIEYIFSQYASHVERKVKGEFDFSKLTFGVEIECYNFLREDLIGRGAANGLKVVSREYTHEHTNYYKIVSDSSIQGANPNEVVTPVLKGKKGLNSLKSLCKALSEIDAKVNFSCGLHVHIGAASLSDEHYCRLVRNYQKLEVVIDSFMPNSRRGNNSRWCRSLCDIDFSNCRTKGDVARAMGYDRYHKVNAEAYRSHKTIEFRQHSGTTDYEKIANWVMFLAKLVEYSHKNDVTQCSAIEEIPLSKKEKRYFINRRAALN